MAKKTAPPPAPVPMVDSKGNRRIYVDLPAPLVVRLNVLAASRNVTKRAMVTALLTSAIEREAA